MGNNIKTDLFFRYFEGRPPRIIFIHGTLDRSASFRKVLQSTHGYETIIYDRRGYGRSQNCGISWGLEKQLEDLQDFIDNTQTVLIGHSYGALLALYAAANDKNIIGSLAYEPPLPFKPWWFTNLTAGSAVDEFSDPKKAAEAFLIRLLGEPRWNELPEKVKQERLKEADALVADLKPIRQYQGMPFKCSEISSFVLLGHGEKSLERNKRASHELHQEISNSQIHEIKGAGHFAHQTHPKEFSELIILTIKHSIGLLKP